MGRQHRVTKVSRAWSAAWPCALLLSAGALCGCAEEVDPKAQMRREVLRANNLSAERRKQFDEIRAMDDNGNLLPSKQRVAGVLLPRGYDPKFKFDYEWYFDGEQPYSKLAKYFTEQLDFSTVQRPNGSTLTFVQARSKGDSEMKPVSLTISPVPGRDDWSRIRIVAQQPLPERLQSRAEIEAELSMRRANLR
jgi:hypothetical protein